MSVAPAQELVDVRFMALSQWCTSQSVLWDKPLSLIPLAAEAGFRRYFRIEGVDGLTCSLLAVDANPLTEDTAQFVSVGRFLRDSRVHTPRVFAADADQGFLLVEDFGDNLLFRQLREDPDPAVANTLYSEALMTLLTLQQSPDNPDLIPRYDQALLRRELDIFTEWFLGALLNYDIDAARHRLLTGLFELLEQSALEQPTVLVHRDFHSRNLLTCSDHSLGVIDFQGALWGPCTYDVVSLLRDCYLRWPESDVERWALGFANLSMDAGIIPRVDQQTWLRWFDWMGLQRHIKVLGIFARAHLRDNKSGFLADVPRVFDYVSSVASRYPELEEFSHWLESDIRPLMVNRDWYQTISLNTGVPA